jgi:hypothetical protein
MKEMSLVFFLQCAAYLVYVAGNVGVILVRVILGFTDNERRNLLYWATLMFVDRLLAYGTHCVAVEVAELYGLFYCVAEVNE